MLSWLKFVTWKDEINLGEKNVLDVKFLPEKKLLKPWNHIGILKYQQNKVFIQN